MPMTLKSRIIEQINPGVSPVDRADNVGAYAFVVTKISWLVFSVGVLLCALGFIDLFVDPLRGLRSISHGLGDLFMLGLARRVANP